MLRRSIRVLCFWLACLPILCAAGVVHAAGIVPLQQARSALNRYDVSSRNSEALAALAQLSTLARNEELGARERAEVHFLRAAAASDLLVLAHVRGDAALQTAVATTLGLSAGSLFEQLDAELARCSQPSYLALATQLRSTLASLKQQETWPLRSLRNTSSSQRDLLFVHAFVQACVTDGDLVSVLSVDGDDPCRDAAHCPEAFAAFDKRGRIAVNALAQAAQAFQRLQAAAQAGDPLLTAATGDLAVLQMLLSNVELRANPRPEQGETWLDAQGAPSAHVPDLVLWVNEGSLRYGFVPRVHLGSDGALELVAAGQPALPSTAALEVHSKMRPFIHPVHELVDWLGPQLGSNATLQIAVASAPDTSALMLGRVLISLKRVGCDTAIVLGRSAGQLDVAQAIRLVNAAPAETPPPEQLGLYVRLGGYSLRLPGNVAAHNIPRIQDPQGWHFDTATLAQSLAGRQIESSQVTFMSGLAAEPLTLALFELGRSARSLELLLN